MTTQVACRPWTPRIRCLKHGPVSTSKQSAFTRIALSTHLIHIEGGVPLVRLKACSGVIEEIIVFEEKAFDVEIQVLLW